MTRTAQARATLASRAYTEEALLAMSQLELLATYNQLSRANRKARFDSKREAVARIQAVMQSLDPTPSPGVPEWASPSPPALEILPPTLPAALTPEAPAPARNGKRLPKNVRARQAELVIRVLADGNPRREGTDAARHFEAMKGGITVREYLAKFGEDEQRVARQWLWNTIRDGHVKTVGS